MCIGTSTFSDILKHVNITYFFKKQYRGFKGDYLSVSILRNISKIFEKLFSKQATLIMDQILSKFQGGFRNGYIAQICFLAVLEKKKHVADLRKG